MAAKQFIDLADLSLYKELSDAELAELLSKKTDREETGANGKGLIFNESDGGGAKFENSDGTWSFVGVNDGGKNGITGQLYSVDHSNGNLGTRLNLTSNGFRRVPRFP